jgi:hypothetical protein
VPGWTYELRWERGYDGIRARQVDSVAKLRAVVEWARGNPHVEKCSYKVSYVADGEMIQACSAGHSLLTPRPGRQWDFEHKLQRLDCLARASHYLTVCPDVL